jgi:hypothetical protein
MPHTFTEQEISEALDATSYEGSVNEQAFRERLGMGEATEPTYAQACEDDDWAGTQWEQAGSVDRNGVVTYPVTCTNQEQTTHGSVRRYRALWEDVLDGEAEQ